VELSPADPEAGPEQVERLLTELLATLTAILMEVSLLPSEQYLAMMGRAFEGGLSHKLGIGRPFDDMAEIVSEEKFNLEARAAEPPLREGSPAPVAHEELDWQNGPGPTYTRDEAEEMLTNRYERLPEMIARTLARANEEPVFLDVVAELREHDWLDWHILNALANISVNHRIAAAGPNNREAISSKDPRLQEISTASEVDGDPLPDPAELSAADLDLARRMGNLSVLSNWNLEARAGFGELDPYDRFLAERYAYWTDDVPHEDPFTGMTQTPQAVPNPSSGE
jgi:hypothetical protein